MKENDTKTSKKLEDAYREIFGIPKSHLLVLEDRKISHKSGRDDEDFYFVEVDEKGDNVSRYHAWHYMSIYPPFKIQED